MNNTTTATTHTTKRFDVRKLVFTALLAGLSYALGELTSFSLPFMPFFISMDFSDVPALLAAFTMGPVSGVAVSFIKNLLGMITSMTGFIGELSNFMLCCFLVIPAGLIMRKRSSLKYAIIAAVSGALCMGILGLVTNYFIVYPLYDVAVLPTETIVGAYQAILPSVGGLFECLLIFNLPFTICKGLIAGIITIPLYKKLRPVFNSLYRSEG